MEKLIEILLKLASSIVSFVLRPKMEIEKKFSAFGRVGTQPSDQFALLLHVKFFNERHHQIVLRSLEVQFMGYWHKPQSYIPDHVRLFNQAGHHVFGDLAKQGIKLGQGIPAANIIEGKVFYHLPQPDEMWPKVLNFKVRAAFPWMRRREMQIVLKDKGN
jgi:hypothetical protein